MMKPLAIQRLLPLLLCAELSLVESFQISWHQRFAPSASRVFFKASSTSELPAATDFDISICPGDDLAMQRIAKFLMDSFWLKSPQSLVIDEVDDVSELLECQFLDLMEKFGQRLGSRLLPSFLLQATTSGDDTESGSSILGVVGVDVRLINHLAKNVESAEASEDRIRMAIASLGPKERRQYKEATLHEIVQDLLPSQYAPIAMLSNLAVSPKARRQGLGQQLCQHAEQSVRDVFGELYTHLYLKVEDRNEAARGLYQDKLGYTEQFCIRDAPAVRIQGDDFVEIPHDTWVLSKSIAQHQQKKRKAMKL